MDISQIPEKVAEVISKNKVEISVALLSSATYYLLQRLLQKKKDKEEQTEILHPLDDLLKLRISPN